MTVKDRTAVELRARLRTRESRSLDCSTPLMVYQHRKVAYSLPQPTDIIHLTLRSSVQAAWTSTSSSVSPANIRRESCISASTSRTPPTSPRWTMRHLTTLGMSHRQRATPRTPRRLYHQRASADRTSHPRTTAQHTQSARQSCQRKGSNGSRNILLHRYPNASCRWQACKDT